MYVYVSVCVYHEKVHISEFNLGQKIDNAHFAYLLKKVPILGDLLKEFLP